MDDSTDVSQEDARRVVIDVAENSGWASPKTLERGGPKMADILEKTRNHLATVVEMYVILNLAACLAILIDAAVE